MDIKIKFNMKQLTQRCWECEIGRFAVYAFRDFDFSSVDELKYLMRKFTQDALSYQEPRVHVELGEEKGKMTKVSFLAEPDPRTNMPPVKKKVALFIPTSLIYAVRKGGQVKYFASEWIINEKLVDQYKRGSLLRVAVLSNLTKEEVQDFLWKTIEPALSAAGKLKKD